MEERQRAAPLQSIHTAGRATYVSGGWQVTTPGITSLAVRLRASHSPLGTGMTGGTRPGPAGNDGGMSAGMSPSLLKRRASIQRVPCSHRSEKRRSYIKAVTNAASGLAAVTVVAA